MLEPSFPNLGFFEVNAAEVGKTIIGGHDIIINGRLPQELLSVKQECCINKGTRITKD